MKSKCDKYIDKNKTIKNETKKLRRQLKIFNENKLYKRKKKFIRFLNVSIFIDDENYI